MTERKPRSLLFVGLSWGLLGTLLGAGLAGVIWKFAGGLNPCVQGVGVPVGSGTTTDTPLKVRGGSMTVFTNISGGWLDKQGKRAKDLPYCVPVTTADTMSIAIDGFLTFQNQPVVEQLTPDAGGWVMMIKSHDADDFGGTPNLPHAGDQASFEGIKIEARTFGCAGSSTSGPSIEVSLFDGDGGSDVSRYAIGLPNKAATASQNARTGSFRFYDRSMSISAPDDKTGKEDEEYQERMEEVDLIYKVNGVSKNLADYCPDGDCSIGIGVPLSPPTPSVRQKD